MKLIRAPSEQNLWAESYERDLGDILGLEQEVASAIARKIEIQLTPSESAYLSKPRRLDPEV